jgi:glycosyltransferase involved in cell wall biosynthesis
MTIQAKILVLHRDYQLRGGEEAFLEAVLTPALKELPVQFSVLRLPALFSGRSRLRDLIELGLMVVGLERLRPSYFAVKRALSREASRGAFTHCIFNNFIPTLSLALPELMKRKGIKTFSWVHNQRLSCANGLRFNGKVSCHLCFERGSRFAILQKCHVTRVRSLLYALVYRYRRVLRRIGPSIDCFIGSSDYSLRSVTDAVRSGLNRAPKVQLVRSVPAQAPPPRPRTSTRLQGDIDRLPRPFYLFVGRVSYEKGADIFADLAAKIPHAGFVMGGTGPLSQKIASSGNLICTGLLEDEEEKLWLYQTCEALVIPSRVPENAPMVIFESQPFGTPVVYPKGGGAEELVRWLGRDGCSLDEFVGQRFTRRIGSPGGLPSVSQQLDRVLGLSSPVETDGGRSTLLQLQAFAPQVGSRRMPNLERHSP